MLGRNHTLLRRLRALRRDGELRREEGVFLAEGPHLASEAIAAGAPVELFVVSPRLEERPEGKRLLSSIRSRGIRCEATADAVLEGLQDARSPQPVLALIRRPGVTLDSALRADGPAVAAWGLQDPGNLGGLWRTADAAGAPALFVGGASVDPFHPRAVRASTGSVFRVPVVETELDPLLDALRERGSLALGATPDGATVYHDAKLDGCFVLFAGREGSGLPADVVRRLDGTLRIPMRPGVESLSVNAAAAVILFEAARQRETSKPG